MIGFRQKSTYPCLRQVTRHRSINLRSAASPDASIFAHCAAVSRMDRYSSFSPGNFSGRPVGRFFDGSMCALSVIQKSLKILLFCDSIVPMNTTIQTTKNPKGMCGIYAISNTINGRRYLGSSQNCSRRFSEHRSQLRRGAHINAKLQAAWNKYGEGAFRFGMIFTVLHRNNLEGVEQEFLDEFSATKLGYNLAPTAGNTSGWKASVEARKRMSDAAKKRDHSVQIAAMAESKRGKRPSDKTLAALLAGRTAPTTEKTREKMAKSAVARSRYGDADRMHMTIVRLEGMNHRAMAAYFGVSRAAICAYTDRWVDEHSDWCGLGGPA